MRRTRADPGREDVAGDPASGPSSARGTAVGLIGAGRMGLGICARLRDRGFSVLATDARSETRDAVERLGASWVDAPRDLAGRCARVLTVLPGPEQVSEVREELLTAMGAGTTWIDLSTSAPTAARAHAALAGTCGVRLLDAPMGGGPAEARDGTLTLFVGGTADDLAAQSDIVGALATRILHVGPTGSGCLVKLLANLLWFGQAVAGAEALALAARAGLAPESVRDALAQSAGTSRFIEREAQALLAGDDLTSFSLAGCLDELRAVLTLGDELGAALNVATGVTGVYEAALARYGDVDGELLAARLTAERMGVTFGVLRP